MKKSYIQPTILVVKIQHSGIICTSDPTESVQTHDEVGHSDYQFTRESNGIWDEEW